MIGWNRIARAGAALTLAAGIVAFAPAAGATPTSTGPYVCRGTMHAPGTLAGTFWHGVVVDGLCAVNGGAAVVHGDVTLLPNALLASAFAHNDVAGSGDSSLSVFGNVFVGHNATAILGCDPQSSPCIDDDPNNPTLSSHTHVGKSLMSTNPLGVIVHNTDVEGNVTSTGGGGGFTCDPQGVFATLIQAPVFSAYEDMTVGGNVNVSGLVSCWLGVNRVHVGGSLTLMNDNMKDPDAIEILSNVVTGNLACSGNSRTWDTGDTGPNFWPRTAFPNTVGGTRSGQCVLQSRTTDMGQEGPGPF
jgi:hypothetical protein